MISKTEAFIQQFGLADWDKNKKPFFSSVHHIRDSPFAPNSANYFNFDRFSKKIQKPNFGLSLSRSLSTTKHSQPSIQLKNI